MGAQAKPGWRSATTEELKAALPLRAPVEKERIETEMRTASGIVNSHGKVIAGVVLITAGYSADGKYSHYLLVQSPITIAEIALAPGSYVFGWQRTDEGLARQILRGDEWNGTWHCNRTSDATGEPGRILSPLASWRPIHLADRPI